MPSLGAKISSLLLAVATFRDAKATKSISRYFTLSSIAFKNLIEFGRLLACPTLKNLLLAATNEVK